MDRRKIVVTPEMTEAGFDAAAVFLKSATPGQIAAAVTTAYYAMRALEPAEQPFDRGALAHLGNYY